MAMSSLLKLAKVVVPEILPLLDKRFEILRNIKYHGPIGRRTLASNLSIGERIIRAEIQVLQQQGLVDIQSSGVMITPYGAEIYQQLEHMIHDIRGMQTLELKVKDTLKIAQVIVIPGDWDQDSLVLRDAAKAAAVTLKDIVKDHMTIGVTGGATIYQVMLEMSRQKGLSNTRVIPARGGIGGSMEMQSNHIAARLAEKLGGSYRLLHVPDNISSNAKESLMQEPEIMNLVSDLNALNILLFGIGRADQMARRRKLSDREQKDLWDQGAVGEAFGYYFDVRGKVIKDSNTIGITLDEYQRIPYAIAVACGSGKAEAIYGLSALRKEIILVIDEGAAMRIIELGGK
jgi:central glycolytic genes regulator